MLENSVAELSEIDSHFAIYQLYNLRQISLSLSSVKWAYPLVVELITLIDNK